MTLGLKRYQRMGHLHFVTFSCFHRQAYLETPESRDLFEDALDRICRRYEFYVIGYVVMPEHVHLLVGEPVRDVLSVGIQSLKLSVARRNKQRPFWQARYYDFNVFTEAKRIEKLGYMHSNPVRRGLVESMDQWRWSSYGQYCGANTGRVAIEMAWRSHWVPGEACVTAETQVSKSRPGAPRDVVVVKV